MEYFVFNSNNYSILNKKEIGEGGNWIAYSINIEEKIFLNNSFYSQFVMKIPKNRTINIDDYHKAYQEVIKAKIPSLHFCEIAFYQNYKVLIEEDYNLRDSWLRVTSNYKPVDLSIRSLISSLNGSNNYNTSVIECMNEKSLSENKLQLINNEKDLLNELQDLARTCYNNNISITEDSIFFTVDTKNNLVFEPFIADFDFVMINSRKIKQNLEAIDVAFKEFKLNYVKI